MAIALNSIRPIQGAKRIKLRVGRGMGSGHGKTAGRGHKGQKSRAGGGHKVGFEGGQMPLHRRLPKRGFQSQLQKGNAEATLADLEKLGLSEVDPAGLKKAGVIGRHISVVKVICKGSIAKPVKLTKIGVTAGARKAIEAVGGSFL